MSAETKVEHPPIEDDVPDTTFQRWLGEHGACDDGCHFVGLMFPQDAWNVCDNPEWMEWFIEELYEGGDVSTDVWADVADLDGDDFTPDSIRALLPVLPDFLRTRE